MPEHFTDYKLKPKKRFGQNFLKNKEIIKKIIDAADLNQEDTVLEIGPGRGALTGHLEEKAKKLLAVEIDRNLAALLRDRFLESEKIKIIEGDFLKLNLSDYVEKNEKIKIVANIPYYITTPIIMKILEENVNFERIVVMVQKEVADRICAKKQSPDYGALSLAVNFYANPSIVCNVPPEDFYPVPKVSSSVVLLTPREPICDEREKKLLFKVIKASFSQRRKTLANALSSFELSNKNDIKEILQSLGFSENIRGESLDLEEFLSVTRKLGEKNGY